MKQPEPFVRAASCFTHERADDSSPPGRHGEICALLCDVLANSLARSNTGSQGTLAAQSLLSTHEGAATKYVDRGPRREPASHRDILAR